MSQRVVVVGEVLCDLFAPRAGVKLEDAGAYVPHLGGAPANVAVQLARLGVQTALVSAVGADPLGVRARRILVDAGVDTTHVATDAVRRTGLTFVEVAHDGARRFFGWRENAADLSITKALVERAVPGAWAVVHGTVSLRAPTPRAATWRADAIAKKDGALVVLDVNLRPGMYVRRADMLVRARQAIARAHVIKASDDECDVLFPSRRRRNRADAHVDALLEAGARLVLYTRGAAGAVLATRDARVAVAAPKVKVVDTTGAGDAFLAAAVASLRAHVKGPRDLDNLLKATLAHIGGVACDAGARSTTKLGATSARLRVQSPARSR
jgi:fructokinase